MKKMWIWIVIILVIAVITYVLLPFKRLVIDHNKRPLAAEYAKFQEIDTNYKSEVFEVSLAAQVQVSSAASPNPIRVFPSVNDQLIIDCDAKIDEETKNDNRYYKVNRKGEIVDSIYVAYHGYWGQFIDDFMVYTSDKNAYYNTWPLNGDTTKHQVLELNTDLTWENKKVDEKIKAIKSNAAYYFYNTFVDHDSWYRQTYFYADEKWQMLLQKMPGYTDVPDTENASRYRKDVFRSGEVNFDIPKDVKLFSFYPEEKMKYDHVIGGGSGGFSVYNWRGKGFFETNVAGRNFEFMVPKLVVEKEKFRDFKPSLFLVSEPGASSSLFNPAFYHSPHGFSFYSPNSKALFLIKVKKGAEEAQP